MSFSKVGPAGGWSFGAKLTSAQQNQLDADHANALDKSVAGDQLAGVVTMASTAAIKVNNLGAQIVALVSNGIVSQAASGISSTTAQGITAAGLGAIQSIVFGGISPGVAGGIRSNVAQGIQASTTNGIQAMVANGITSNVAGGIADGGNVGGIQSTTPGGIRHSGGSNDWVAFNGTRSRNNQTHIMQPRALSSGWTISNLAIPALVGPATSTIQYVPLDWLHDGATLSSLAITFQVSNNHASVPAQLPTFALYRFSQSNGAGGTASQSLYSGGSQQIPNPGSGAAWYASAVNQFFNFTPDQNNVLNVGTYVYVLAIIDENGANSIAGNLYLSLSPLYSNIANMAFA